MAIQSLDPEPYLGYYCTRMAIQSLDPEPYLGYYCTRMAIQSLDPEPYLGYYCTRMAIQSLDPEPYLEYYCTRVAIALHWGGRLVGSSALPTKARAAKVTRPTGTNGLQGLWFWV